MPLTLTYNEHPETKPANQTDKAGQVVETVGTTRTAVGTRFAVTLTYWTRTGDGQGMITVDHEHGQKDYDGRCRQAAVRWLRKVLADRSNDARFYE